MKFKRRKGFAMLVNMLIAVMVMGIVSSSLAIQQSAYFTSLDSGRTALQAQQIAAAKANEINVISYSDLPSKAPETRAAIAGTIFDREVVVGAEIDLGSNNKKRDVTVNIYKSGESQARFSLPITLSSQGSSAPTVAVLTGTIPHGAQIPLPDGYTQDECKWFVSFYNVSGFGGTRTLYCWADSNRYVTAYVDGEKGGQQYGSANYVIIGVKK